MLYSICVETIEDADLAMCGPDGQETMRLRDVPFHAAAREIIFNEQANRRFIRTLFRLTLYIPVNPFIIFATPGSDKSHCICHFEGLNC